MSSPASPSQASVVFEGVCPILRVKNAAASIDYYVQILGFKRIGNIPRILRSSPPSHAAAATFS